MIRIVIILVIFFGTGCMPSRNKSQLPSASSVNVVLIVADDLGRNDVGCYGNTFIETPHIDKMAAEGIRFTNAYAAAPLCSPTRASIITGNNPARINLTEHLHGYAPPPPHQKLSPPRIVTGLPQELTTIPEALKPAGYISAHFGKWHLGGGASSPASNGFDIVYGGGQEGLPKTFFYPFFGGEPYKDLLADTKTGDYLDDALTSKAIAFMNGHKSDKFFIELNFYAPHVPIEGKPELVKKYAAKRKQTAYRGLPEDEYAAMVENIDYNIGRVLAYLRESGLAENTVVLFTSDNGGLDVQEVPAFARFTPPTTNAPLRAGKGYLYEGGIREPWIIWAPSMTKKPRTESHLVSTDDIFNTTMELTGVKAKSPDGVSIVPLIRGKKMPARDYCLHFPHYSPQRGRPGAVIRRGDYKLIEWYEDGKLELFNLVKDPGEKNDLSSVMPGKVNELKIALAEWRQKTSVKMPELNPGYRSSE